MYFCNFFAPSILKCSIFELQNTYWKVFNLIRKYSIYTVKMTDIIFIMNYMRRHKVSVNFSSSKKDKDKDKDSYIHTYTDTSS